MQYQELMKTLDHDTKRVIDYVIALSMSGKYQNLKLKRKMKVTEQLDSKEILQALLFFALLRSDHAVSFLFSQYNITLPLVSLSVIPEIKGEDFEVSLSEEEKETYFNERLASFFMDVLQQITDYPILKKKEKPKLDVLQITNYLVFQFQSNKKLEAIIKEGYHLKGISEKEEYLFFVVTNITILLEQYYSKLKRNDKAYVISHSASEKDVPFQLSHAKNLKKKPNISKMEQYGRFLTDSNMQFPVMSGRDAELREIETLLLLRRSIILTGPAGVGKSTLVYDLARMIRDDANCPDYLKKYKILEVAASTILSDTMYRGSFENKMKEIVNFLIKDQNTILFMDEIHSIIGAGSTGTHDSLDGANILKPYLNNGEILMIGTTTDQEYDRYIKRDPAFKRRFGQIAVSEPNMITLGQILNDRIGKMEQILYVKFCFSDQERKEIIDLLILLTKNENRDNQDEYHNPHLAITILE